MMEYRKIAENLCIHDKRNPLNHELMLDEREPRQDCACDNCHTGKDRLAVELLNQQEKNVRLAEDWELFAMSINTILVWSFRDAPECLKVLSTHGGDEDWVALVPQTASWPTWADDGTPFGVCDVSCTDLHMGGVVLIGAHA